MKYSKKNKGIKINNLCVWHEISIFFVNQRGVNKMTYIKHLVDEVELVLILTSVLFLVTMLMIASASIIALVL